MANDNTQKHLNKHLRYLLICLPFTVLLLLQPAGDSLPFRFQQHSWVQLLICLPVYIAGMNFFGRSAVKSIRKGKPNMNVLIATGATAAFLYSLAGTVLDLGPAYLFYETSAAVITLVFLGYYLEDISIGATQKALNGLAGSQKIVANMIAFDEEHRELIFPVDNAQLRNGDLLLVRSGEQVPADCRILWGEAEVNESIITGESLPVHRQAKDQLIGGSVLVTGTVKTLVTAEAGDSVISHIIGLVKQAQQEKPLIQQLADRISSIFIPVVLAIAAIIFLANYLLLPGIAPALMRGIAVLVIACPCAMGLATPAAIAVGLGRAARQGILIRNARTLESFKNIRQVVFDKTGTLTTGEFSVSGFQLVTAQDETFVSAQEFQRIAFSLEKYSAHPIAKCITKEWRRKDGLRWEKIEEIKGLGMRAETKAGDVYQAGSYKIAVALGVAFDESHNVYIVKNQRLLGWIDVKDTIRPEAPSVISYLHSKGIRTILLSGDRLASCQQLAQETGIREVIAEQTPEQKLGKIAQLNAQMPTAMIGDGINDAPALAKATIGISLGDASQLALQTADVVLMSHGLKQLPLALGLGKHTFLTIRQNLFWAFFYNIIAIPVAALGLLTPAFAALVMGFSDVVLALNSVRLFVKKVI
jgi:Cu+-exporting ATPase